MTEETSVVPKQDSPPSSEKFPILTDWRLSLMEGAHIAEYMPTILESILNSLPPSEKADEVLRANISGAIVDGRIQIWAILGKVEDTGIWRPVGYMTTSIRPDEITGKSSLLIYTMFSYAVIPDDAWSIFDKTLVAYAIAQGCAKIALYTANSRVLQMTQRVGYITEWHFVYKNLE